MESRKRKRNPQGPETRHYPELAHLSEQEHDELPQIMDARAQQFRHLQGPQHPLFAKPRSRAIWPAQHPRCTICGELLYRYNYDKLKCQRSLRASGDTPCWNHVQVSCAEIRNRVLSWVINHCQQVDGFRDVMIEAAWTEIQRIRHQDARKQQSIDEEVAELKRRSSNLAQAIAKGGHPDVLCSSLPRSRQT